MLDLDERATTRILDCLITMGALFALNMLVSTSAGDVYSFNEIKDSLEMAGFEKVAMLMTGERMDCLVEARKLK